MKKLELASCPLPGHKYKKANQEHAALSNKLDCQFGVAKPNQVWFGVVWCGVVW